MPSTVQMELARFRQFGGVKCSIAPFLKKQKPADAFEILKAIHGREHSCAAVWRVMRSRGYGARTGPISQHRKAAGMCRECEDLKRELRKKR